MKVLERALVVWVEGLCCRRAPHEARLNRSDWLPQLVVNQSWNAHTFKLWTYSSGNGVLHGEFAF